MILRQWRGDGLNQNEMMRRQV